MADMLIKNGATLDTIDFIDSGKKLLFELANKEKMVKFLIGNGVNLTVADNEGLTLLHYAAKRGKKAHKYK